MIVYHGSYMEIKYPDTEHSRETVDFGRGFYVTPIYDQAKKWAEKFKRRGRDAVISKYNFDENALDDEKVLKFDAYSEEWLDFIVNCRSAKDQTDYAIVMGGVANDKIFNTIELFFDGLIDKREAIKRLQYEKPNMQICLRKQSVIDKYIEFEGSEAL